MAVKNRPCPKCRENGHDSQGNHLYLSDKGDNWLCPKVQHHDDAQYCIIPNDPETDEPITEEEVVEEATEEVEEQIFEKAPEKPATERSGSCDTLAGLLAGSSGEDEEGLPDLSITVEDLPAVDYREIPAHIREKYGCKHSLSEEDRSVEKVFYPVFKKGIQVSWKERDVEAKKFYVREL